MRARVWGWTSRRAIHTAGVRSLPVALAVLAVAVMAGGSQAVPRLARAGVHIAVDGSSSAPAVVRPRMDCAALVGQDLSGTPDAAAVIGSATVTTEFGWEACEVKGTAAPQ